MAKNISVSDIIPARPERVYSAWLSADEHGKMTGSTATDEGDGRFTAWDGYISGRTVSAVPHSKIVQAWRTTEFPEGDPDSLLTITFEPSGDGTKLTFDHQNLPAGQAESYAKGWEEYYFTPMKAFFGSPAEKVRAVGEKLGEALEEAGHQVEAAAGDALKAVDRARVRARKQAVKTVQAVKKAQKKARARLQAVGKQVKAFVSGKKKAAPKKKKVAAVKAKRKPAAKKKPAAAKKKQR